MADKEPRGIAINFICVYLAQYGPSRAAHVLKAYAKERGWKRAGGEGYFYWGGGVIPPRRGLRFKPGYHYSARPRADWYPECPLWFQMWERGPWALTPMGWERAARVLRARGANAA